MSGRWTSRADIIQDISRLGMGVVLDDDIEVVQGKPPVHRSDSADLEDMMRQLCGGVGGEWCSMGDEEIQPDLQGISQYIRMVREQEGPEEDLYSRPESPQGAVLISKLNPNSEEFVPKPKTKLRLDVQEFVPKETTPVNNANGLKTVLTENSDSVVNNSKEGSNKAVSPNEKLTVKTETNNCSGVLNENNSTVNNIDKAESKKEINNLNSDEVREIALKLKDKITCKSTSLQQRRERNTAIATLLRLYSTQNDPVAAAAGPKLLAPDFFAREMKPHDETRTMQGTIPQDKTQGTNPQDKAQGTNPQDKTQGTNPQDKTQRTNPQAKTQGTNLQDKTQGTNLQNVTQGTRETKLIENKNDQTSDHLINFDYMNKDNFKTLEDSLAKVSPSKLPPHIEHSIIKVNDWFDKPETPKPIVPKIAAPKPFVPSMEPITFKKKSPFSSERSSPHVTATGPKPKPITLSAAYVPSSYATDLCNKYKEQHKKKQAMKEDIWTSLEKKLKERDEIKKAQMAQNQEENAAPNTERQTDN